MSTTGCDSSSWCFRILTRRSTSRPGSYQAVATQKDVAQEVMLRAYRFFPGFYGEDVRAFAAADRPQHFVYVVGEESPNEADGPI